MWKSEPFYPAKAIHNSGPLARFLPPFSTTSTTRWLENHVNKGEIILAPFGASPFNALEAASAGYRVIWVSNNPIIRFLLEFYANPKPENDLKVALSHLADIYKGNQHLETVIRNLYVSTCENCGHPVEIDYFVWTSEGEAPITKVYRCPFCQQYGEFPTNEKDIEQAKRFKKNGLQWSQALERITSIDDPDRIHALNALNVYLPRAVYALFNIVNGLEKIDEVERSLLHALVLPVFDQANSLWSTTQERIRPRSLGIPHKFKENNLWFALEQSIHLWQAGQYMQEVKIPVSVWPNLPPPSGGISIFEGKVKKLHESLRKSGLNVDIKAIISVLPRYNQAFWTLSALWTAWLFGKETAEPIKNVIRRRRYDWSWHTGALSASFRATNNIIRSNTPAFGLIGELEPNFLSASIIASKSANFSIRGIALHSSQYQCQINLIKKTKPTRLRKKQNTTTINYREKIIKSILDYLNLRLEPAEYINILAVALDTIDSSQNMNLETASSTFVQFNEIFHKVLTDKKEIINLNPEHKNLEIGKWWGAHLFLPNLINENRIPLSDRVEKEIVTTLVRTSTTFYDIDIQICNKFKGTLTPSRKLIKHCLDSYGKLSDANPELYYLQEQDKPSTRKTDLNTIQKLIIQIGSNLGFYTEKINPASTKRSTSILWRTENSDKSYLFVINASAIISKIVFMDLDSIITLFKIKKKFLRKYIVLPGSRANLITYKLKQNPLLFNAVENDWRLIKFRHIRNLANTPHLNLNNIDSQLMMDPFEKTDPQLPLF